MTPMEWWEREDHPLRRAPVSAALPVALKALAIAVGALHQGADLNRGGWYDTCVARPALARIRELANAPEVAPDEHLAEAVLMLLADTQWLDEHDVGEVARSGYLGSVHERVDDEQVGAALRHLRGRGLATPVWRITARGEEVAHEVGSAHVEVTR